MVPRVSLAGFFRLKSLLVYRGSSYFEEVGLMVLSMRDPRWVLVAGPRVRSGDGYVRSHLPFTNFHRKITSLWDLDENE